METVAFTQMKDGTFEDYQLLQKYEPQRTGGAAKNLLDMLEKMKGPMLGYKIDRYEHSLQTATRAHRDGADEEMVVAALLHDIGDIMAPENHSQAAAAILRPYVSERTHWVVGHHGIFQGYYFWHHLGQDRNAREQFRGHPHYEACIDFCERWDQNSFDPEYDTMPLAAFTPMVERLFSSPKNSFG
ncbi:MAG: HD domain-containing protein [Alphaproteobacteria bacterium]|nr:HD domain-containing protein [Alphaproteobacteria bacterium]